MKGMKRILSLFCAAVVLCTGINLSYAAESADGGYSEYKYMIDILNALNITKISEKGFSATDKVSRETFALSVAQMMSDDPQSLAAEPTGDLSAKDAGMLYLRSVGLIDGTDENVYEPKRNITLEQAIKISVSALGYGDISYYKGGYSSGFIGEAKRAGLLDGVNAPSASDLELGDCVKLLYNLLRTDVLEQKTFGSSNTYYRVDGNTLVSVYRNIRRGEGVVSANRFSGLYSENEATDDDRVVIDKVSYKTGTTNAEDYLGYSTEYYYLEPKGSDDRTILYITPRTSNRVLKIMSRDIVSFDGKSYSYENKNGKTADAAIADSAVVLYNGVFQNSLDRDKFIPEYGSVEFISNDGDGKYDVVKIESIDTVIVSMVSSDSLVIYDKFSQDFNIDLTDAEYEIGGGVKAVSGLVEGNIVESVKIEYSGGTYYKMTAVCDTVNETVEKIKADSGNGNSAASEYGVIYLAGEGYTVSERLKALFADGSIIKPSINTAYVFSFNSLGELVYMDEVSEKGYRVAYFKRFALGDGSIDPERKVRVFDQSGNWETYTLAKNIKLNGNRIKSNTLKNMDLYIGKVCKYELNIAGEVTSLYFPSEDDENFRTVYSIKNAYYRTYSAGGYFGAQNDKNAAACSLDPSACVFVVPNKEPADVNELADGYQYAVLLPGKLKTYITYSSVEIYNTTGEIGIGDAAVAKIKNNGYAYNHYGDRPIVISNIENTMVGDEVKPVINGYYNGNTIQIIIDDHRSDQSTLPLKSGDAIYCFTQDDGELRLYDDLQYYHKILDYDEQNPVFAQSFNWNLASPVGVSYSSSLSGDQRIRFGSVYKVNSDYLWLNVSDDPSDTSAVEAAKCSNARVYVYDKDDEEFEIGKVSDIVGYTSDRTNYSKALIVYNGGFTEIVIY